MMRTIGDGEKMSMVQIKYLYRAYIAFLVKIHYRFFYRYASYVQTNKPPSIEKMRTDMKSYVYRPLISILTPLYCPKSHELTAYFDALLEHQGYEHIEICLVADGVVDPHIQKIITQYIHRYPNKINFQENQANQGISVATNQALQLAKGEYVALVDQDDLVTSNAFYEYVRVLQKKKYDFLYSDEDMLDSKGQRCQPQFKPDWSPHTLLSRMYVNHLSMYRSEILRQIGGFRSEFDGAQDYEALLRASKYLKHVYHCPKILYHWRKSTDSIAENINNKPYIYERAIRAVGESLEREHLMEEVVVSAHQKLLIYDITLMKRENKKTLCIIWLDDQTDQTDAWLENIVVQLPDMELLCVLSGMKKDTNICQKLELSYIAVTSAVDITKLNQLLGSYELMHHFIFIRPLMLIRNSQNLQQLANFTTLKDMGMVGATMIQHQRIVESGVLLLPQGSFVQTAYGQKSEAKGYYGRNVSLYNFICVSTSCVAISSQRFMEIGGFETDVSCDYTELMYDLQLKLYSQGYYNCAAGNIHIEQKNMNIGDEWMSRRLAQKWHRYFTKDPFYNLNFSTKPHYLYRLPTHFRHWKKE